MAVALDATGTKKYQAPSTSFSDATVITVGSGNALIVPVSFGYNSAPAPTSVTATWGGTSMTLLGSIGGNAGFVSTYIFGLRSPTAGAQTLALAWTNSCEVFVDAISFTGADVTNDVTAFPYAGRTTKQYGTAETVNVISTVGNYVVAAISPSASGATPTGTTLFDDSTSGSFINAAANYDAGAATVTIGTTGNGNTSVLIAAADVAAPATTQVVRLRKSWNRSPLAFPSGDAPGFNRTHVVGTEVTFSSVAVAGGNHINLMKGQVGAITGTVTPSLTAAGGFGTTIPVSQTAGIAFANVEPAANKHITSLDLATLAAIFRVNGVGTTSTFNCLFSTDNANTSGFGLNLDSGVMSFLSHQVSNPALFSGLTTGTTYFLAVSNYGASVNSPAVLVNLGTGKMQTAIFTGIQLEAGGTPSGTYCVGNISTAIAYSSDATVHATMVSPRRMSMAQLQAWAQDPWAFWYPPAPHKVSYFYNPTPDVTTTNGARLRQRWNRSPLAYPSGVAPGFDPTHPAAQNITASAVVSGGGNFVNLPNGMVLASQSGSTAPGAGIDGSVGPFSFANATTAFAYGFPLSGSPNARTLGAIFRYVAKVGTNIYQSIVHYRGNGCGIFVYNDDISYFQGADTLSGLTLTAGKVYFVATSNLNAGGNVNFVVRDLTAGGVVSSQVALGVGSAAPVADTGFVIGNDSFGEYSKSDIAAAMYSQALLSPSQLLQWAQDPWSFWYPRQTEMLIATAASVASATQYAAFSIPQHGGRSVRPMIGY